MNRQSCRIDAEEREYDADADIHGTLPVKDTYGAEIAGDEDVCGVLGPSGTLARVGEGRRRRTLLRLPAGWPCAHHDRRVRHE